MGTRGILPSQAGILVLDSNCYRHLREPAVLDRVLGSLSAAGLELWATGLNALELSQNAHPINRERDLATLRKLTGDRSLLPLPETLLKRAAEAITSGQSGFWTGPSEIEGLLEGNSHLRSNVQASVKRWLEELNRSFEQMHDRARPVIQALVKARALRGTWPTAREFLDEYWMRVELHNDALDGWWKRFGLTPPAPHEQVLSDPVWRAFLEVEGIGVYERAILANQPRQVQFADLIQLLYLTGTHNRILVSDDKGLLRAGKAILVGRYRGVRVMTWPELAETFE